MQVTTFNNSQSQILCRCCFRVVEIINSIKEIVLIVGLRRLQRFEGLKRAGDCATEMLAEGRGDSCCSSNYKTALQLEVRIQPLHAVEGRKSN
mmetsp:Transcript_12446/g.30184  ORF Transcript_12446/g.30184 Transcript_12446/m.30184 type:complete len:93 (-) Transcript_12446:2473-2751(-)